MQRFLLTAVLVSLFFMSRAASVDDIKRNPDYIWGEGIATTGDAARKLALDNLISQISTTVESDLTLTDVANTKRSGKKISRDSKSEYKSVIRTYSAATLENCQEMELPAPGGQVCRFLYVKKDEISKIFAGRRKQIYELMANANRALSLCKMDVALKNYYWAYALLRSMPGASYEEWAGKLLITYIPECIDQILDDVKVELVKCDGTNLVLSFTYKGQKVTALDYYVYEGGFAGPLLNACEGLGDVYLSTDPEDKIGIEIEYKYLDSASDPQLAAVLKTTGAHNTKRANKTVYMDGKAPVAASAASAASVASVASAASAASAASVASVASVASAASAASASEAPEVKSTVATPISAIADPALAAKFAAQPAQMKNSEQFRKNVSAVLRGIASKANPATLSHLFTEEALAKYHKIIRSGNARVLTDDNLQFYVDARNEIICRGAVMTFRYRSGKYKSFTRDVVFTFEPDGKITNISLGLGEAPRADILGTRDIPEMIRQAIVQFIENYQTAYAVKDLQYIDKIFSDNAIIITGTKLAQQGRTEDYAYRNNEKIIYYRSSKSEYLDKLKNQFGSREYINLRFNKIKVVRISADAEVYGIQLEQEYFSPSYSDFGYLYLQCMIKDPANPVIHVRTWQPAETDIKKLFNESDFPILL